MELDVHIVREVNCAWGFTLVGGNDSEIPLTVIKVLPNSPAERAGLRNGDTVLRIEDQPATEMTHAEASEAVTDAVDSLVLGVVRGLYDPVLDDYEPIYEPIDQDDTDQPSDPSEVLFKVAEFIEVPPPLDSRSLTASPFQTPTKPYRPFSTEPIDVPPLEDPIILNPEYKDVFPQHEVEDILQIKPDIPPESRFKLPISPQYDPEGKKIKKLVEEQFKHEKTVEFKEEKQEERKESQIVRKKEKEMKREAEFLEKMKKEIDLEKIEMTASEIVEESIQKAVSVAEEIKHEIDLEISSQQKEKIETSEMKSEIKETETRKEVKTELKEQQESIEVQVKEDKAVSELVELIDKTTEEIIKQSEVKDVKKEVEKFESMSQQDVAVEERKLLTKQEIEETIEAGSVRRKSMMFESEAKAVDKREDVERIESKETLVKDKQASVSEAQYESEVKESISVNEQTRRNDAKMSTSRLLAEQRAYTIGLQTIPNIRGSIHSPYHYNLLLKTFFIHLTDVMVALSRFILTEPVFSEDKQAISKDMVAVTKEKEKVNKDLAEHEILQRDIRKKEEIVYEKKANDRKDIQMKATKTEKEVVVEGVKDTREATKEIIVENKKEKVQQLIVMEDKKDLGSQHVEKQIGRVEEKVVQGAKGELIKERTEGFKESRVMQDANYETMKQKSLLNEVEIIDDEFDEEFYEEEEFIETRRKTGAEMAQMAERKSADLIEKLDAVITEFQGKAGIEVPDKNATVRRTRSRSRSKAQERAARDSKAREMSYEMGKRSHEITEMQSVSSSQTYEAKKMERRHETRELKTPVPQTQDGNVMYVAIVESHVYTNKDAIFEEMSAQSNETRENIEATKTERTATESSVTKEQVAQTVIHKAQEIEQKSIEVSQPIQVIEDIKSVRHQASTVIETAVTDIAESSEVIVEEVQDEVLKVQEPPAKSLEIVYEATAKAVAESSEAYVEEVKTEDLEITPPKAIQAKEIVENSVVEKTVAESIEVRIEEAKHEEFTVEEAVVTKAAEVIVENKAIEVAEEISVPVEKGMTYEEASAELKIVKLAPVEIEEPVVVISEVELELLKRDVADAKVYESIVGVQTAVQEKHEALDVSQVASYKSVGETKLDKKINIEEVEEIPVQVIAKTEVSIEGLNESETKVYQEALSESTIDASCETKSIKTTLEVSTQNEESSKQSVEEVVKESTFEAKSVSEASYEAKTVSEASFEAKSVSEATFEAKSVSESTFEAKSVVAESKKQSFESVTVQDSKTIASAEQKLSLQKEAEQTSIVQAEEEKVKKEIIVNGEEPQSPAPETPLTNEYLLKLEIPLPKTTIQVPRDCTPPNEEDPNIVKKKLVPNIETTIESYTYEPPLPTPPPGRALGSPDYKKPGLQGGSNRLKNMRYYKPGLRGGADRPEVTKEEILEIERTSSLLASAIDKTIKSIEEYKEEVGIEAKKETKMSSKTMTSLKVENKTVSSNIHTNGTVIKESAKEIKDNYEKEWKEIEKQVQNNHKDINELSVNVTIEEANGNGKNGKEYKDDKVQIIEVEVSARNGQTNGYANSKSENSAKTVVNEEITKTTTESNSKKKYNGTFTVTVDVEEPKILAPKEVSETNKVTLNGHNGRTNEDENENQETRKEDDKMEETQSQNVQTNISRTEVEEPKIDPMQLYRPVKFDPEEIARRKQTASVPIIQEPTRGDEKPKVYMTPTGEIIGTQQGIVDGLEEAVVDSEVAKALGKPGMPDEKIAELISGEAEMLREAHVMGLARVLSTHMHRDDDSSVDFQKIKPVIESLKDSEVLKALNEEVLRAKEQKKKEEKKWTTFLQKPKRPVPRQKYGYYRYVQEETIEEEPYKVKIVKQPKPKVAPDYKPEDFDTGPLPWEQSQPEVVLTAPVEPEEPILIPEEQPQFLEAVDPLPESEVPDLEDTGIPLPPPPPPQPQPEPTQEETEPVAEEGTEELDLEAVVEETEKIVEEMEGERLAEQLLQNVQKMVDPNATLEQQLAQMRAQIAALAQLPCVIQQTLDLVTRQISQLSHQETARVQASEEKLYQVTEESYENENETQQEIVEEREEQQQAVEISEQEEVREDARTEEVNENIEVAEESQPMLSEEELAKRKKQEEEMFAEQQKIEKQRKDVIDQMKLEQEARQVKQRPTPRVGKPKPMFGPPVPVDRPLVLPGGRKWRRPQDVYNEQLIAETLNAQAEIINGKVMGNTFESVLLPYDERINFMKYEKPPVSLDHLQRSEVYKVVHNLDEKPLKRVETLTPVIAEADYRERCRSISPYPGSEKHQSIPQQLQP